MPQPSIRTIARHAGVSVGTVSRVLHGATNILPDIRERALAAMRELHYIPVRRISADARFSPCTGAIGVLHCGPVEAYSGNHAAHQGLMHVERASRGAGLRTLVERIEPGACGLPACIRDRAVDGVLIDNAHRVGPGLIGIAAAVPAVALHGGRGALPVPRVGVDDHACAALAVRACRERGHRRIAFVDHAPTHVGFRDRARAYRDALDTEGLGADELLITLPIVTDAQPSNAAPPDLSAAAAWLLALSPRPTAVIVANDWGAAGLYRALRCRGVTPGRDLSVVGFDDAGGAASLLDPPLATIAIPFAAIAEAAVDLLLRGIARGGTQVSDNLFPGNLIARESLTSPP